MTQKQKKVLALAKAEIKKHGEYVIPYDHPDCELTRTQARSYADQRKTALSLVKKGLLVIEQQDRRVTVFNFPE